MRAAGDRLLALCVLALWAGSLALLGGGRAEAQERSCSTTECHSQMGRADKVHPPLLADCTICHQPQDPSTMFDGPPAHSFRLASQGAELCYMCHDYKNTGEHVHGPVSLGLCTACHDPHQSSGERLLRSGPPELCFQCHSDKEEAVSGAEVVHPPAGLDCTMCHDPHTSPNRYQLKGLPPELCLTCHLDIQERMEKSPVRHGALSQGESCLNCHDPHASENEKLAKRAGLALCLGCHDQPQTDTEGRKLADIGEVLESNPNRHGPLLADSCVACHDPHGSPNFRMLQGAFPETFYAPFGEETYALCFGCHGSSLATESQTTLDTDFRNGDKNLHFVHVNKRPKGRTCRACHRFHASSESRHLRRSTAFGRWEFSLNYEELPNGGRCFPGCHGPRGYDRQTPVENPIGYEAFGEPEGEGPRGGP